MAWNIVPGKVDVLKAQPKNKKPKIMILMPQTGSASFEFIEKTWMALKAEPMDWCERQFMMCRVPSLPLARNILFYAFLGSDADLALWLDSDMILENNMSWNQALGMMYKAMQETGENIVSGLYRAKQQHGFNYAAWKIARPELNQEGYEHIATWQGNWLQVDVVGLGCCLMSRKVFLDLDAYLKKANAYLGALNLGEYKDIISVEQPFHWEKVNSRSEDFNMLDKCRKLGHKVWVLTDVKLSHEANVVLNTSGQIRVHEV